MPLAKDTIGDEEKKASKQNLFGDDESSSSSSCNDENEDEEEHEKDKEREEDEFSPSSPKLMNNFTLGWILETTQLLYDPNIRHPEMIQDQEWVKDWYEFADMDEESSSTSWLSPWVLRIELDHTSLVHVNKERRRTSEPFGIAMRHVQDKILSLCSSNNTDDGGDTETAGKGFDLIRSEDNDEHLVIRVRVLQMSRNNQNNHNAAIPEELLVNENSDDHCVARLTQLKNILDNIQHSLYNQISKYHQQVVRYRNGDTNRYHDDAPSFDWVPFMERLDSQYAASDVQSFSVYRIDNVNVETSVLHEICYDQNNIFTKENTIPLTVWKKLIQVSPHTLLTTYFPRGGNFVTWGINNPPYWTHTPLYHVLANLASGRSDLGLEHVQVLVQACSSTTVFSTPMARLPNGDFEPGTRPIHLITNMITLWQSWNTLINYTPDRVSNIQSVLLYILGLTDPSILLLAHANLGTPVGLLAQSFRNKSAAETQIAKENYQAACRRVKNCVVSSFVPVLRATIAARRRHSTGSKATMTENDMNQWLVHEALFCDHAPNHAYLHRYEIMQDFLQVLEPRVATVALQKVNQHGQLPLHVAIRNGYPWATCVKVILDAEPAALTRCEIMEGGMFPFMLMAVYGRSFEERSRNRATRNVLDYIYILLRQEPDALKKATNPDVIGGDVKAPVVKGALEASARVVPCQGHQEGAASYRKRKLDHC